MKRYLSVVGLLQCVQGRHLLDGAATTSTAYDTTQQLFQDFKQTYNKTYASAEVLYRYRAFQRTLQRVEQRNQRSGGAVFGITKFADLTELEFKNTYLSAKSVDQPMGSGSEMAPAWTTEGAVPAAFDWRARAVVVASVQDQGACGSCWAFSAAENVASVWELQGPGPALFPYVPSVQQIVDCDSLSKGCSGGSPLRAFDYAKKAGGLESETTYPYLAASREVCQIGPFEPSKPKWFTYQATRCPPKAGTRPQCRRTARTSRR